MRRGKKIRRREWVDGAAGVRCRVHGVHGAGAHGEKFGHKLVSPKARNRDLGQLRGAAFPQGPVHNPKRARYAPTLAMDHR